MKPFLLIALILACSVSIAQTLTTITATAGRGQNVDWAAIKKEENADKDGPGFFYHDCAQGVEVIAASSELKGQGAKNYSIKNLSDDDPMTAWVEGKPGYGIGESFSVKAIKVNTIYNGYQSSPLNWKNNSRVKKFKVYLDNKVLCYLILKDEMGEQNFELPFEPNYDKYHLFKFEIADVYKGIKWDDVAISHVDNNGCCVGEETLITFDEGKEKLIPEFSHGEKVLCLDSKTGTTLQVAVSHVVNQVHLSLLQITTENHQIRVTADHPLLVKDVGFSSLSRIKSERELERYEMLVGIELMVWDESEMRMRSEKIIDVKKMIGEFKTYMLKGLPEGSSYIANGFITKSY